MPHRDEWTSVASATSGSASYEAKRSPDANSGARTGMMSAPDRTVCASDAVSSGSLAGVSAAAAASLVVTLSDAGVAASAPFESLLGWTMDEIPVDWLNQPVTWICLPAG